MTQAFSLYGELTIRKNLVLHARLYHLPPEKAETRIKELVERFGLESHLDALAEDLPMGLKQRLSLAVAVLHEPANPDPRRADVGRRSGGPRQLLGAADRPVARAGRHDLRHHPLHERGDALRPHLPHARGEGAGLRRADKADRRRVAPPASRRPSSATWRTRSRRRRTETAKGRPASPRPPPRRAGGSRSADAEAVPPGAQLRADARLRPQRD